jgi:hypothetical protein
LAAEMFVLVVGNRNVKVAFAAEEKFKTETFKSFYPVVF